jgi:hypothetical protein
MHFVDATKELGLEFVSFSGTTLDRHFPTANGTGLAMLDVDQDGLQDLYFANSARLDIPTQAPPNELFRSRDGAAFEAVGSSASVDLTGFTQGVAAADFNNDGFPDLYLIRLGPDILLQNNGDGTFRNVAESSGLDDPRWGTSAAFFDYDEDGNLDVYIANYGQWDFAWHDKHFCGQRNPLVRIYCSPKLLTPEIHGLYRNLGDGTFRDVAGELGIARNDGRGQGVVACDVNNDGHIDLYVANDLTPNFLFINTAHGGFQDMTESSCAAYNAEGKEEASMGVDAADVDGDGFPELFVTNFYLEHNTLYRNLGKQERPLFQDVSHWAGVAAGSIHMVGWGTALEDLDSDGWLDIFVANGHVDDNMSQLGRDEAYAQKAGLWRNVGKGRFEVIGAEAGAYFETRHVSRGTAFGDLNNDGQLDLVVTHKDESATVLRNESLSHSGSGNSWLQLLLIGRSGNRDAIGARVEFEIGDVQLTRHVRGGKSYLAAHDPRLTVGLGAAGRVDRMTIYWPSGRTTELQNLEPNRSRTYFEAQSVSAP